MSTISSSDLDLVFGSESFGTSPASRAETSNVEFVRGQYSIAIASDAAKGRRMSPLEALAIFKFDHLLQAASEGQSVFNIHPEEPATTIRNRRIALGYTRQELARLSGVDELTVSNAETPGIPTSIRVLEKFVSWLSLDERLLGAKPEAEGDARLGVRLKALRKTSKKGNLPLRTVAALAEGSWITSRQINLEYLLETEKSLLEKGFEVSDNYHYPTWKAGYDLAERTRNILNIERNEPITSMRALIEDLLGIPLINCSISDHIAGATVANGETRGIVINTIGQNSNVWVRRMTLAHELGHLLWDPEGRLNNLRVDNYNEINKSSRNESDKVEARANAFAISFLAPPSGISEIFQDPNHEGSILKTVCEKYGISVTAAIHHIKNVTTYVVDHKSSEINDLGISPSDEWCGREDFTNDYFPIKEVRESRRGRFALLTIRAAQKKLISWDSAASYLEVSDVELVRDKADLIISTLE